MIKHLLFLGLCLMAAATTLFGQDWSSSKNTLLSFSVKSSAAILERLDSYELTTEREKDLYVRYQDTLNVRLARVVLPVVYSQLAAAEITLEPKDALVDLVTYGQDGLPSILIPKQVIKRLANKGYTSDHYFVIKINMEAQGMMGGVTARVKPRARCQIKVFAAARKVVKEVDSERVATDFIRSTDFPRRRFDKIGLDYIEMLQARMEPLVLRAVEEAVGQL